MSLSSCLALVGLGAFHGLNPAMGWLFAVALGLHRKSRAVVLAALVPIAIGHALAVGVVALAVAALGLAVDERVIRASGGIALIGWAVYHRLYGSRHRVRVGMRTGMAGLVLWSFLMASAHGAGLMLVPFLLPADGGIPATALAPGHHAVGSSLSLALAAVGVHTLAMLAVTGAIAVVVYEWVGVAFLRRGWINVDLLWTAALVGTGVILLVTAAR
ncbi:MAG TPA: hypothetical protein VMT79_04270 [Candidatus Binatia bacterium]|nr:hypothetical protein [Candidatus Binatia bacterium]